MSTTQLANTFRRLTVALASAAAVTYAAAGQAQVLYTLTDLGVPTGLYDRTFARAVNDHGQIAGYSDVSLGTQTLGWRYSLDAGFHPLGLPPNATSGYSTPFGINNAGQVVGDTSSSGPLRAFRWSEGTGMELLPTLPGGIDSHAIAINDATQVAGTSGTAGSSSPHVVRWAAGGAIEDLGIPAGRLGGFPRAINNNGQVALSSVDSFHESRAFLFTDGSGYRDLGTLGGRHAEAWGINDMGQVVGSSYLPGGPPHAVHAFVWSEATGMRDIGTLPGGAVATALSINARGEIVGESEVTSSESHAFLYREGVMLDLNDAIDSPQDWILRTATDVSDTGLIIGWGTHSGEVRSFMLTPAIPEPETWLLVVLASAGVLCADAPRRSLSRTAIIAIPIWIGRY